MIQLSEEKFFSSLVGVQAVHDRDGAERDLGSDDGKYSNCGASWSRCGASWWSGGASWLDLPTCPRQLVPAGRRYKISEVADFAAS